MSLHFSQAELLTILNKLNIQYEESSGRRKRISILCPFHNDTNLGSAYMNTDDGLGQFKCYSCGKATNIIGIIKHVTKIDEIRAALESLSLHHFLNSFETSLEARQRYKSKKPKVSVQEEAAVKIRKYDLELVSFDPQAYSYTRLRGFTQEFVDTFNIKLCKTPGRYYDYMIIPIVDKERGIDTFEARRLKELEYFQELFKQPNETDMGVFYDAWHNLVEDKKYRFADNKLYQDGRELTDPPPNIVYLMQRKCLYPYGFNVNKTIYNIDNLDRTKPLIMREGITGIAKIWYYISKNVTALFGADVTHQKEILNQFQHLILIPDMDDAGDIMVSNMARHFDREKFSVWLTPLQDTHPDFIQSLRGSQKMEGMRYLIRKGKMRLVM